MAIMLPNKPYEIPLYSREDEMFSALEELSDEYYIFHSFRIISETNKTIHESETDFVIFHPRKGIMCIEAKAGQIKCEKDTWYYSNGTEMKKGGPFKQADLNKWKLKNYFEKRGLGAISNKCKFIHAVWFPSINKSQLNQINMPPTGEKNLVLTCEDLITPQKTIEKIFDLEIAGQSNTTMNSVEIKKVLDNVLCPSFELLPLKSLELERKNNIFAKMLKEQSNILNFMEEQPTAIINGMAGTGKTLIAVEKARRHSENGEKVLFLCYNKYLCVYLKREFKYSNVSFYTIDGFACAVCNNTKADYNLLKIKLEEMYYNERFEYKHVIIDEAQDFGQEKIEEQEIIELLEDIVLSRESEGTFYLFYDKNQLVQGYKLPKYIQNADCKLTLYKNCRNTENIATTSARPLMIDRLVKMKQGSIKGELANIYIKEDTNTIIQQLNKSIDRLYSQKINDIVILTCSTEENSMLNLYIDNGMYNFDNKKIKFTTCRKFKGLEADAIILIDVSKDIFVEKSLLFYVGASRAKFNLEIFSCLNEDEYDEIAKFYNIKNNNKFKKTLAAKINTFFRD